MRANGSEHEPEMDLELTTMHGTIRLQTLEMQAGLQVRPDQDDPRQEHVAHPGVHRPMVSMGPVRRALDTLGVRPGGPARPSSPPGFSGRHACLHQSVLGRHPNEGRRVAKETDAADRRS